ncbi:thioredoxin family protein [Pontibacter vulgaris]|uniref:thioredoxin family protein n=1 Tax=Pontibacter vulgaris TaxID=2905679 RepID=UPI001FA7B8A0|nr:DUF255 domain-containing protein [Pontibacter vulgaris]
MLHCKLFFISLTAILSLAGCKVNNNSKAPEPVAEKETSTTTSTAQVENNQTESKSTAPIKWLSIEEAAARQKVEPRKMVIDVYTDWCGWCKKMDKSTFTDPEVAAYINKNYYAVKLDAEGKEPITLNGRTFKYNPEYKAHELAVALLNGQMSFPSTVYLDEEMKMLSPVPGYLDAPAFSRILSYFGENHHKTMSWQEYEKK